MAQALIFLQILVALFGFMWLLIDVDYAVSVPVIIFGIIGSVMASDIHSYIKQLEDELDMEDWTEDDIP